MMSNTVSVAFTAVVLWRLCETQSKPLDRQLKLQIISLWTIFSATQLLLAIRYFFRKEQAQGALNTTIAAFLASIASLGFASRTRNTVDVLGIGLLCFLLENERILWFIARTDHRGQDLLLGCGRHMLTGLLAATALFLVNAIVQGATAASMRKSSSVDEEQSASISDDGDLRSCTVSRIVYLLGLSQCILAVILTALLDRGSMSLSALVQSLFPAVLQASSVIFTIGCVIFLPHVDAFAAATLLGLTYSLRIFLIRDISVLGGFGLVLASIVAFRRLRAAGLRVQLIYSVFLLFILAAQLLFLLRSRSTFDRDSFFFSVHPLDALIRFSDAGVRDFESHEASISTLARASIDYNERYSRLPPPGFAEWFRYAHSHNTVVISNYDQIEKDLAPFRFIEPVEIRRRTYIAVQNRYNYISPLRIRNGSVTAPPMEIPTHYWMLERLMEMMQDFVQYLPDMDIAINLNDEPRVLAERHSPGPQNTSSKSAFFTLTEDDWLEDIPFTDETPLSFEKFEREYRNTFDLSTRFCPDGSPARSATAPQQQEESFSAYLVQTWQATLDICNQPQLKDNRGFFVSPTTYDATDELLPVFSQSKPSTFSDILLPSPWNFGDKVGPDTLDSHSWSEKWDRVYWRGSTTEGWATMGSWRQMLRQTFVDLLGGADERSGAISYKRAQILQGRDDSGYVASSTDLTRLHEFFDPDVFLVDIVRSDEYDATDQANHFRLQPPSEFRDHWRHRYLLDADGAAFSGRFLPFLNSNSLPLKFTSVFTEWWSDRIFAYQHFVPVTTESIFGILAYFIGFQNGQGGKQLAQSHQDEAERIALAGRIWAEKVLRKEDMKLYLWRLLLEYGRLVDDFRDHIGFNYLEVDSEKD